MDRSLVIVMVNVVSVAILLPELSRGAYHTGGQFWNDLFHPISFFLRPLHRSYHLHTVIILLSRRHVYLRQKSSVTVTVTVALVTVEWIQWDESDGCGGWQCGCRCATDDTERSARPFAPSSTVRRARCLARSRRLPGVGSHREYTAFIHLCYKRSVRFLDSLRTKSQ